MYQSEVLRVGDYSPRIAEVRLALARFGFIDGFDGDISPDRSEKFSIEDEYFDTQLQQALKAFQQQRGINVDGEISAASLRAIREASYTLGARVLTFEPHAQLIGDDVADLQQKLADLGFFHHHIDGHFNEYTYSALRNYQLDYSLTVDGILGPKTLRALSYLGRRISGGSAHTIRERENIRAAGSQLSGKRVLINPALGGEETGRTVQGQYGTITEEEILWDLASRLEGKMVVAGMETIVSRPRSANPTAQERADIANAFGADLMITLSCDSYANEKANGAASFYYGSSIGQSSLVGERLSARIQSEVCSRTGLVNCYNHARTWDILRLPTMPSVQFSAGYLSNPRDVSILTNPDMRDIISDAIVVAVKRLYLLDTEDKPTGTFSFSELVQQESLS